MVTFTVRELVENDWRRFDSEKQAYIATLPDGPQKRFALRAWCPLPDVGLYVWRVDECVLYVGISKNVVERLYSHLGDERGHWAAIPSEVGKLYHQNRPESGDWTITVLSLDDLVAKYGCVCDKEPPHAGWLEDYKYAVIDELSPALNASKNRAPGKLPEKILAKMRDEQHAAVMSMFRKIGMVADEEWTLVADRRPPAGLVVETKIDDEHGARNEQPLIYRDRLWWTSGYDMYVYYVPTHWRARQESK